MSGFFSVPIPTVLTRLSAALCVATALSVTAQTANAGASVDQLSNCLVKSTTATDKTAVLQWTFAALSAHPDLKQFSNVTETQKTQLDKNLAQVLQIGRASCRERV